MSNRRKLRLRRVERPLEKMKFLVAVLAGPSVAGARLVLVVVQVGDGDVVITPRLQYLR